MKKFWWLLLIPVMAITIGQRTSRWCIKYTVVSSALHTSTDTSSTVIVSDYDQLMIFYNLSGLTANDSLFCLVQTRDPLSGNWANLDSTNLASGYLTDTTLVMKSKLGVLGEKIRVISTISSPDSITFSISVILK